jgi:hypothetical protein
METRQAPSVRPWFPGSAAIRDLSGNLEKAGIGSPHQGPQSSYFLPKKEVIIGASDTYYG